MSENRLCRFNHVTSQCRSFLIVFMQSTGFYLHININNLDMFYVYTCMFFIIIFLYLLHTIHIFSHNCLTKLTCVLCVYILLYIHRQYNLGQQTKLSHAKFCVALHLICWYETENFFI